MLTRSDIAAIQRARKRLIAIESRLEQEQSDYPHGRLAEACRAAEAALLQILICSSIRLSNEIEDIDLFPPELSDASSG